MKYLLGAEAITWLQTFFDPSGHGMLLFVGFWECWSPRTLALRQSALGHRQAGTPAQPNPLLHVISEASPEQFHSHLRQPAQTELTQPELFFDPSVGKLSHRPPLSVGLLG